MKVFIPCGSKKVDHPAKAKDMYIGSYFKKILIYSKLIADESDIYIVSGKYGLLSLNEIINPYNLKLSEQPVAYKRLWADLVKLQLEENKISCDEKVISFLPIAYRKPFDNFINIEYPIDGLGIGLAGQFIKNKINEVNKNER